VTRIIYRFVTNADTLTKQRYLQSLPLLFCCSVHLYPPRHLSLGFDIAAAGDTVISNEIQTSCLVLELLSALKFGGGRTQEN
jgi:hypothetical protein